MTSKADPDLNELAKEAYLLAESLLELRPNLPETQSSRLEELISLLEQARHPAALNLRGLLSALRGQEELSRQAHQLALAQLGDLESHSSYSRSLELMGYPAEALEQALKALQAANGDFACLGRVVRLAYEGNFFGVFFEHYPRLKQKLQAAGLPELVDAPWNQPGGITLEELDRIYQNLSEKISKLQIAGATAEECYRAACASGIFRDWESEDEEAAWGHLE